MPRYFRLSVACLIFLLLSALMAAQVPLDTAVYLTSVNPNANYHSCNRLILRSLPLRLILTICLR